MWVTGWQVATSCGGQGDGERQQGRVGDMQQGHGVTGSNVLADAAFLPPLTDLPPPSGTGGVEWQPQLVDQAHSAVRAMQVRSP